MRTSPPRRPSRLSLLAGATAVGLAALLSSCRKSGPATAAPGQPLPVDVTTVKTESVTLSQELPGRISAFRVAEVRARINGIVLKRLFTEGTDVHEGQVLFVIDPAPYQAALDSARASLARSEANLASAQAQAERYQGLAATHAISQQAYDDAVATHLALQADVAAARAAVRTAEINLGYTSVTAPISGRIGTAAVTEGAYVQQATATLLATVQQLDPVYVDLSQSADQVLALKQALASGRLQRADDGNARLAIILGDGQTYGKTGSLQFSDVSVNPGTGTVTLRGLVPNPDHDLLPGMFVRGRLDEGTNPAAILLPQNLVTHDFKGDATALVVGAGDKVEVHVLEIPRAVGNRWLVTAGLQPGDRVITDNLQKVRPGMMVKPLPAADQAASTSGQPAAR
ncbi:MAG TPA: efflux RND transporter periplasmic adaptor subunit [Opitutus sp.]|nr:efflux RND transporter periplasmic adaptor subunit [Opitutus sp.]